MDLSYIICHSKLIIIIIARYIYDTSEIISKCYLHSLFLLTTFNRIEGTEFKCLLRKLRSHDAITKLLQILIKNKIIYGTKKVNNSHCHL